MGAKAHVPIKVTNSFLGEFCRTELESGRNISSSALNGCTMASYDRIFGIWGIEEEQLHDDALIPAFCQGRKCRLLSFFLGGRVFL